MKRLFATAAAGLAIAACGPAALGGAGGQGTVAGQVLAYPCAPVERIGSPCPGRPAVGVTVQLTPAGGGAAESATTGNDGRYRIEVAAGRYTVTVKGRPFGAATRTVDVAAGATVSADFVIDSGIR